MRLFLTLRAHIFAYFYILVDLRVNKIRVSKMTADWPGVAGSDRPLVTVAAVC